MLRSTQFIRLMALVLAVVFVTDMSAEAQERGRRRGGRFSFRGLGGSMLLGSDQVQKELKLGQEQTKQIETLIREYREKARGQFAGIRDLSEEERHEKLENLRETRQAANAELTKKLTAILDESQNKRFQEISLQVWGISALQDVKITEKLKITKEQKQLIDDLISTQREMRSELFSGLRDLSREERRAKMEEVRKKSEELQQETQKAVEELLTDSQKTQFTALKGKEFKLDRGQFRRRGGRRRSGRPNPNA